MRCLELFSGIGGLHAAAVAAWADMSKSASSSCCSCSRVEDTLDVVAAYDINDLATRTYALNFPGRDQIQSRTKFRSTTIVSRSIAAVTAQELNAWQADTWLMSPPCQPFTRQGAKRDAADNRSHPLLKLIDLLKTVCGEVDDENNGSDDVSVSCKDMHNRASTGGATSRGPRYLLLENVRGFETSETRNMLVHQLHQCGFAIQEFLLSPNQFGIPNSRLRYFLLARRVRAPLPFGETTASAAFSPAAGTTGTENRFAVAGPFSHPEFDQTLRCEIPDCGRMFGVADVSEIADALVSEEIDSFCAPLSDFLDSSLPADVLMELAVPSPLLSKGGMASDIVTPDSHRTICFTKAYGKFIQGTGSILRQCSDAEEQELGPARNGSDLVPLKLRFLSPTEIARLHGFPESLQFPSDITLRQRFQLLGNSLNVVVVCELLKYLWR